MKFGGFQKTSLVDFPGRVSSILFTPGCNFRCGYCYNPELVFSTNRTFLEEEAVLSELERRKSLVGAVVVTGGEPTIWPDLLVFLAKLKGFGLFVKLDTNGTRPDMIQKAIKDRLIDYLAMDVKAPWAKYARIAGACTSLDNLRQSVDLIKKSGVDYEFRTTLSPGLSAMDLKEIAYQIGPAKRWLLQTFRQDLPLLNPSILNYPVLSNSSAKQVVSKTAMLFQECGFRGETISVMAVQENKTAI